MDDHYILPSELALLLGFFILPPLLVASGGQVWFMLRRGVSSSRAWLSVLLTATLSTFATVLLFLFGANALPHALGVQDFFVGHLWFPILPLAFLVVALVSPAVSLWVVHRRV